MNTLSFTARENLYLVSFTTLYLKAVLQAAAIHLAMATLKILEHTANFSITAMPSKNFLEKETKIFSCSLPLTVCQVFDDVLCKTSSGPRCWPLPCGLSSTILRCIYIFKIVLVERVPDEDVRTAELCNAAGMRARVHCQAHAHRTRPYPGKRSPFFMATFVGESLAFA